MAAGKGKTPQTIREMLLWLYWLGQQEMTGHKQRLEIYIGTEMKNSLTRKFSTTNTNISAAITKITDEAKRLIQEVCNKAGEILVTIQNGKDYHEQKSKADLPKALEKLIEAAEWKTLDYPTVEKDLYNRFVYYVTACFWQLRFLNLKCYTQSWVGGWGQCQYGKQGPESSDACKRSDKNNHKDRCTNCTKEKYKGCLQHFLTGGSEGDPGNNIYTGATYSGQCTASSQVAQGSPQCIIPPMGFEKNYLPMENKAPNVFNGILGDFFNNHTKPFPKLLGHLLILQLLESSKASSSTTLQAPSSWQLPHLVAFWAVFMSKWNGQKTEWQNKFKAELNGQGTETQYKWTPGNPYDLLGDLFQEHKDGNASNHQNNNTPNHNSLLTLTGCQVNTTSPSTHCGKYFHGILEKPFHHVLEQFRTGGVFEHFMNHETIKEFAKQFYQKFQAFQQKLQNQTCVKQTSCTCIVHCDGTHSCMYQHGITFNSSTSLAVINNGTRDPRRKDAPQRKCSDLNTQLENVLKEDAPLWKLTRIWKILSPVLRTVHSTDNHNHGVDRIKEVFNDVLKQLAKVTARAAAAGVITTARFLNAHHSSLLEPPCNVKECIDWLIRVAKLDKKRLTGNNNGASSNASGLFIPHCMVHGSAGTLRQNSKGLASAIQALTGSNLIRSNDVFNLILQLSLFIGYTNGEVDGKGIATASYYSAYRMSAQWPRCGQGGKCSSCKNTGCQCSTPSTSKASSCDGQCCDTCDVRTCVRIFLLIVPVLRNVLMYLYNKCKKGGKWASQTLNGTNGKGENNATDLKNFMELCGFKTDKLSDKTGFTLAEQQEGTLTLLGGALNIVHTGIHKALQHKNESSKKFLRDGNKNGTGPKTIAEVCLWLYFLPYCTNYKKVVKELKTNANKFNGIKDEFTIHLQTTVSQFTTLFNVIEGSPSGGNSLFQRIATLCRGEHIFQYPQPQHLLKDLGLYVYKVHTQLRFLMVMCNTDKDKGGWKECEYTGNGQQTSVVQPSDYGSLTCQCGGSSGPGSSVPAAVTCPLLLRAFLTNGNEPKRQEQNGNVFKLYQNASGDKEEHYQMGFSIFSSTTTPAQGALPTLTGKDIYNFLKDLVDDIPRPPAQSSPSPSTPSKPLSLLTQHCVAIGPVQPESLGDLFAFFAHLGTKWQSLTLYNNAGMFKEKLTVELNDYQIGNEGTDKSCGELQKKIKAIIPTTHSTHDIKDLMSLMCTNGHTNNDNCSPYMKSLSQGVYHYYCPKIQDSDPQQNKFTMLQYLYDMLRKLLDGMKKLKGAFDKCDCCKNTGSSSCQGLISCPYAHPILYKFGFVFGEPGSLSKKCTDIKAQLGVVLQCEKDQESVLFSAFECVIQVTYKVLLEKAKGCVTTKAQALQNSFFNNRNGDKEQWEKAFYNYVTNAMYISYPKLICTFACKLFNGEHDCNTNKCSDFEVPGPPPNPKISRSLFPTLEVTKSNVTLISPIIPQYTAPHIDCYHYKTFNKQSGAQAKVEQKTENTYGFRDAIDFHIQGAQCILPVPSNLRSAVDWMLRVTVGVADGKNNDNNNQLSEAVKSVLGAGVPVTGDTEAVQKNVTDLVQGLRKFVGYEDRSENVKTSVTTLLGDGQSNNGVKGALQKKIEVLNKFIGQEGSAQFGTEMGKALLKGRYAGTFKQKREGLADTLISTIAAVAQTVTGIKEPLEQKTFKDAVKAFSDILKLTHEGCKELQCNTLNNSAAASQGDDQKGGLEILKEFLSAILNFATYRDNINKGHDNTVFIQLQSAEVLVQGQALCAKYFSILLKALTDIGECYKKMGDLITPNGSITSTSQYRSKIDELKKALEKAIEELTEKDGEKGSKADVRCAVSAATALMKKTKERTDGEITKQIRTGFEGVYPYIISEHRKLDILRLVSAVETATSSKLTTYHSHLDDLKQLCQWLYRMGQLYAHGLKGFVESLVKHLEHIIQVIKWIEKLHKNLNSLNKEIEKYGTEDSIGFTRLSVRYIEDLLHRTYVLHELPQGTDQNNNDKQTVQARIQLLLDLRLLALDRYTLQVWQDECNKNAKDCRIRDWITFEGGIVRHSNLEAVKSNLSGLTGIDYNSNTASSSATGSPSASSPTPRSRIQNFHAICVIQKFSFEAPIAKLERSLKELNKIQGQLSAVKQKCESQTDVSTLKDDQQVTSFSESVSQFLQEPYGIYSLAKFVHTILGPNVFSAVIGALEELTTDKLKELNGDNGKGEKRKKFCGIVTTMCEGLQSDKANKEHYKLERIITKLSALITTLRQEYIFSYPVVCGIEFYKDCKAVCPGECDTQCDRTCSVQCCGKSKDASLVCSSQSSVTPSLTSATSTVSLTSPLPSLCVHCHLNASICPQCIPLLARMFITLVPVLYPQLCYLAYQCRLYWQQDHMNGYKDSALSSLLHTFGWPKECLSDSYIGIDVRAHGRFVSWLLTKTENTLQLLCDNFTEEYNVSPFNTESPFYRLYTQCLQYYRCRKNERLTDYKSRTPVTPTSLRQILRFFVYLQFSAQFDALQCTMQRYCSQSCVVDFSDVFTTMMMSSAMSAVLLQLIECPQGAFLRFFDDIYTNKEGLYLDNNTENLFYHVCDLTVTLYRGLKFLSLQCSAERSLAGWKDCRLRGVKRNKDSEDISQALDPQQLQLCAPHLCECIGAKDSSTTTPMGLTSDSSVSTLASHTTVCPLPLLRYLTDADCFFDSTLTVPSALRKVCLNDSCQEMIYRHMAPRGWEKELLQCAHRDSQQGDRQLEVCNEKACSSVCHSGGSDPDCSDYSNCCCRPCCGTQCCVPVCSTLYGHDLFLVLRNFVGHEHDADPLLQFTRYMVAIAAWPPDSVSGYMTFMLRFSDQLRKEERDTQGSVSVSASLPHGNTSQKNGVNTSVLSGLRSEISLFPGEFDPECLIEAFLNVTHCEHNNGVAHTALASSSTDTSCLSSSSCDASLSSQCPTTSSGTTLSVLSDCKDCQRLLRPLDYEVYDLHLPMYARRYLTWMLHFGPRLHRGMRALEKEFKRHIEDSASQSGICATDTGLSGSRTSVQCHASVLRCPFALPELHSAGLHFRDPKGMCSVSCQCLVERLQCSIQDSSPLAEFLRQCDSFLWSVRKRFYWLTMALWIVATVYLLFVHLWRLDSWRLLSHVIRSRASHLVYPKVLLSAELEHSYERYYAQR